MPTTSTQRGVTASSRRVVASVASWVPIPVTMATTVRPSSVPACIFVPFTSVSVSESMRTSGESSIGIAQTNAMGSFSEFVAMPPACRISRSGGAVSPVQPSSSGSAGS
jgi:hypothetical protein